MKVPKWNRSFVNFYLLAIFFFVCLGVSLTHFYPFIHSAIPPSYFLVCCDYHYPVGCTRWTLWLFAHYHSVSGLLFANTLGGGSGVCIFGKNGECGKVLWIGRKNCLEDSFLSWYLAPVRRNGGNWQEESKNISSGRSDGRTYCKLTNFILVVI